MKNLILNIILVFLLGFLLLFAKSSMMQLFTIVGIVLLLKLFTLENKIDALQEQIDQLTGRAPKPAEPNTVKLKSKNRLDDQSPEPEIVFDETDEPTPQTMNYAQPSSHDTWFKKAVLTGNPMAKIGVFILFIGMTFFIKYVAEHNLLSIEIRHIIVALAGILMVCLGLYLRHNTRHYAHILSGGGVALMYLSIYSAFYIYHLIEPAPAFLMMLAVVILTGLLSVLQDAKWLAFFGITGGFLAPVLVSTGTNNYIFLFSYYLVLNVSVLSLAFYRSWWELNLAGFIFTFAISALWGHQSYQPEFFSTTQPFLITFFLFYVAITILYAWKQPEQQRSLINSFILFANPLIAFGMQMNLVQPYEYGIAWSALTLTLFYAVLAAIILHCSKKIQELGHAFCGLSIIFATITIPYTFTKLYSSTAWALQSILLLVFSIRLGNHKLRLSSSLVMFASLMMFLCSEASILQEGAFFNAYYLSAAFIIFSLFTHSCLLNKYYNDDLFSARLSTLFLIIGIPSWYVLNLEQIYLYMPYQVQFIYSILFISTSCLVCWMAGSHLKWDNLRYTALALLPAMIVLSLPDFNWNYYFPPGVTYAWIYSFIILYSILYLHEEYSKNYLQTLHLITFVFVTWFIVNRVDINLMRDTLTIYWRIICIDLIPTFILLSVMYAKPLLAWPLQKYDASYLRNGGLVITGFLFYWIMFSTGYAGDASLINYFPILNPLDLSIIFTLATIWVWRSRVNSCDKQIAYVFALVCFIFLNAILLRSMHYYLDIPYAFNHLWNSVAVQATVSIFWSIIALVVTTIAARIGSRELWFLGFTLMSVVIVKLFLVDLSDANTVGRVVTFIGVGMLMLINGYISPLPPKNKD